MATKQDEILAEVRVNSALLTDLKNTDIKEIKEHLNKLNTRTDKIDRTAAGANTKAKIALYISLIAIGGTGGSAIATKLMEMW